MAHSCPPGIVYVSKHSGFIYSHAMLSSASPKLTWLPNDWSVQGYKGSVLLSKFETTLNGHLNSRVPCRTS